MKHLSLLTLASSMLLMAPVYAAKHNTTPQPAAEKAETDAAQTSDHGIRFGLQATAMANLGMGPTFIFAKEKAAFGGGILLRDHETTLTTFAEWRKKLKHPFILGLGADYTYSATKHSTADNFSTIGPRVSLTIDFDSDITTGIWLNPYVYSGASFDKHHQFMRRGGISVTFYY